ncbi:MAG: cytochrome C [Sulfurovaceae bacterium]|nr:cytochrome C [Sulfurovaceae bacterium]MDD5405962.1 cytochrome C [Sulfurovaceae bacterium]
MKKLITVAAAALLGLTMVSTTASADVAKGQKIFAKNLKAPCGMTGAKFAAKHTQDQWEAIKDGGKFGAELKKICPKASAVYKDAWTNDLYDFSYEYASDSGNVPSC